MRQWVLIGAILPALLVPNALIAHKEGLLARGQPVLLELAPVDPRSLIEGDYMRLNYRVTQAAGFDPEGWPRDGHLVIRLDENGVGEFVRRHDPAFPLGSGEFLLRYRIRERHVRLGAEAFFFHEGLASRYSGAKYGELRVTSSGESVLVGLRDGDRRPINTVESP
jgi:uncharacterized membrane-anchored protein